MQLSSSSKNEH